MSELRTVEGNILARLGRLRYFMLGGVAADVLRAMAGSVLIAPSVKEEPR